MNLSLDEKTILVNDVEITYVAVGSGPNAAILLPGSMGSYKNDMMFQLEGLPKLLPDYTIISWNIPGMLPNPRNKRRKLHLDIYQDDAILVNAFMQALGFKTYSVLGWCSGGRVGIILSSLYPEVVKKLVIWGTRSYVTEHDVQVAHDLRNVMDWSENMREPQIELYGVELAQEFWSDCCHNLLETFKKRNGNYCVDKLAQVQCPTFILHGALDFIATLDQGLFLQNNIKDSEIYIFPEGKHNIQLRYAEEFNELVAKFLLK